MGEAERQGLAIEPAGQARFDACCQLCSRLAGQVVGGRFAHHPDCAGVLTWDGRLPRCCACGGTLYLEPSSTPMSSAADREAARFRRPSHQ